MVVFLQPGSCYGKGALTIRSVSDLIPLSSLLLQEWRYPDSDCYCWHLRICLENRSVSNLIEVMADERWERLVEQQGVAYAKTVAEARKLKLDMDNPADREKLRRVVLDLVAGRKMPKQKGRG